MIVDIGTGDGRAVFDRARADPRALVIGLDANASAMAEASNRAFRGRVANAVFLVEAAEALPGPLAETAKLVTMNFPWGSLLRGVLGLDDAVLHGIAGLVAPDGMIEVLTSVVPGDHVVGLDALDRSATGQIAAAWGALGFELVSMRPATAEDVRRTRSSWARRLGHRPAWQLAIRRCGPADRARPDRSDRSTCAELPRFHVGGDQPAGPPLSPRTHARDGRH